MKRKQTVRDRLAAGPVRGLGCTNAVAKEAACDETLLKELVEACADSRGVVSHRAANAVRKVQEGNATMVNVHAAKLLRTALDCEELMTRWNLTRIVGGLTLNARGRALATELFFESLESASGFERAFGMQGLVNLAGEEKALLPRVRAVVMKAMDDPSAAMRARARKILRAVISDQ